MKSANFQRRNLRRTAAEGMDPEAPPTHTPPSAAPVDEALPKTNPFVNWPKDALSDVLSALGKYAEDKGVLDSIEMLADELRKRPEPPAEEAKAASKKKAYVSNEETGDVIEGDLPEVAAAKAKTDPLCVEVPNTESPSKFAGEMTVAKAAKLAETTSEKLKAVFIDVKPITAANETRPVRDAVDLIFTAYQKMGMVAELLDKQSRQEEAEADAQAAMLDHKKKSSAEVEEPEEPEDEPTPPAGKSASKKASTRSPLLGNLKVAASEEKGGRQSATSSHLIATHNPLLGNLKTAGRATRKDRATFQRLIAEHAPKAQSQDLNEHAVTSIAEDIMRVGSQFKQLIQFRQEPPIDTPEYEEERGRQEEAVKAKLTGLCDHLGVKAVFGADPRGYTVKVNCPDGFVNDHDHQGICVPTS